jgi:hypothetical protein
LNKALILVYIFAAWLMVVGKQVKVSAGILSAAMTKEGVGHSSFAGDVLKKIEGTSANFIYFCFQTGIFIS